MIYILSICSELTHISNIRPPSIMDSSYTYQQHLTLLKELGLEDRYEAVLYQNKYFSFHWQPYSPYGERFTSVCNMGVSALMNELKSTRIDIAVIVFVNSVFIHSLTTYLEFFSGMEVHRCIQSRQPHLHVHLFRQAQFHVNAVLIYDQIAEVLIQALFQAEY